MEPGKEMRLSVLSFNDKPRLSPSFFALQNYAMQRGVQYFELVGSSFPLLLVPLPFFLFLVCFSKQNTTDTLLSFQPCRASSFPILSIEYHQLIHPDSRKRAERSFEFRIQWLLPAGKAQSKISLHIVKCLS